MLPDSLDIRTLLFVVCLISLLSAIGLAVVAFRFPRFPGFAWFAVADALLFAGTYLVSMRDYWPDLVTTVVANACTLGGMMLNAEGFKRYAGGPWPWWSRPYPLLLILIPTSAWFTFVEPSVNARILLFSACAMTALTGVACGLWHATGGKRLRLVTALFAGFAAFMLIRVALTAAEAPMASFMNAGWLHATALLLYLVFIPLKNFGILLDGVRLLLADIARQARTDPLTGLLNRRGLQEMAMLAHAQSQRRRSPLSVLMLDIDHFKSINDHHGHSVGDAVLQAVARLLQKQLRAGDVCARVGGEEFLVLLPDTAPEPALQVAEKLRAGIAALDLGAAGPCTASFGMTRWDPDTPFDGVAQAADRALYRAKDSGRNKVVMG